MAFDKVHVLGLLAIGLMFVGVSQSQDEEQNNPCKANPCGHGVCLVDNENA